MSLTGLTLVIAIAAAEPAPRLDGDIAPLLKQHCVKCHGPVTAEGRLNLSTPAGILRGGESGLVVLPHDINGSPLWKRIAADEMPPKNPLSAEEKQRVRLWIEAGAPGLPSATELTGTSDEHWAFQKLLPQSIPDIQEEWIAKSPVDRFLQAKLEPDHLTLGPETDRPTLIRRLSFDLLGLPPVVDEIDEFLHDASPDAVERLVDRYLASPRYGERFGKVWLDAAGYADSNGYFSADTDRPLAYRYRDYVIQSLNADKPFDRFVQEQIAGDELIGWTPETPVTSEVIEALIATHFLRNGQDGTGESDGNPDEVRADRYYALEGTMQIVATSLLGLTIQCAKCHEHKFEPILHRDYYEFQAVFAGVFHHENWSKPNDRFVLAALPSEQAAWAERLAEAEAQAQGKQQELKEWLASHSVRGRVIWQDAFESLPETLAERWSATAPGDDAPGGEPAVNLDSTTEPAAQIVNGQLQLREAGGAGNRWLVTRKSFDWSPQEVGAAIQVTFDLIERRLDPKEQPAARVGYYIAAHDFHDNSAVAGGNILIDGNPDTSSVVDIDYPGPDAKALGSLGTTPYAAGRNYGVRITRQPDDKFLLEHLVDGIPEDKTLALTADQLPDGGFAFEFCCGRSFVVDNVTIEQFDEPQHRNALTEFAERLQPIRKEADEAAKRFTALKNNPPGKIAWAVDLSPHPPAVQWLNRGDYGSPKEPVNAGPFSTLADPDNPWTLAPSGDAARTTGRRLAWANWVTHPDSRPAALLARVQANRIWQHHFGIGIVSTAENFGLSGSPPAHPALLDWLAREFVNSGWSTKSIHRRIVNSRAYQQTSRTNEALLKSDPDGRRHTRFPIRRLDADAIRDQFLRISDRLNDQLYGPYVNSDRKGNGEVVIEEDSTGAGRRSVYLYQRRTQIVTLLQVFDSPSIVFNSLRRTPTTIPLQSLNLLNSEFMINRATEFTDRLLAEEISERDRLRSAGRQIWGREPTPEELQDAEEFLSTQIAERGGTSEGVRLAWIDLNQMLMAASAALYIE